MDRAQRPVTTKRTTGVIALLVRGKTPKLRRGGDYGVTGRIGWEQEPKIEERRILCQKNLSRPSLR